MPSEPGASSHTAAASGPALRTRTEEALPPDALLELGKLREDVSPAVLLAHGVEHMRRNR